MKSFEKWKIDDNEEYYTIVEIYNKDVAIQKHYRKIDNEKIGEEVLKNITAVYMALERLQKEYNGTNKVCARIYFEESVD